MLLDVVDKDIKVLGVKELGVVGLVSYYGFIFIVVDSFFIWLILEELLKVGGVFSNNGWVFIVFYYVVIWLEEFFKNEYVVIIGSGVCICSELRFNSDIVKIVFYELV